MAHGLNICTCGCEPLTVEVKAGYGYVECPFCLKKYPDISQGIDMMTPSELIVGWNRLNPIKEASEWRKKHEEDIDKKN